MWSGAALTAQTVTDLKHRPMELRYSFDPEKWYLGTLCSKGHRWPGTDLSVRWNYKRSAGCAGCKTNPEAELPWLFRFIDNQASGVPAGHKLGRLCSGGHSWNGTGYTLRRHGHCAECGNSNRDPERRRASKRAYYQRHIDRMRTEARDAMRRRVATDPLEKLARRARAHRARVRNRGNHHRSLTKHEIHARFAEFNARCAYCRNACDPVLEHFIPRSKGGPHALGNILPACHQCNSSKTDHDPEQWFRAQPFFSEKQWRLVLRVLGKAKAGPDQLPLL